jgi:hypothetical protein
MWASTSVHAQSARVFRLVSPVQVVLGDLLVRKANIESAEAVSSDIAGMAVSPLAIRVQLGCPR